MSDKKFVDTNIIKQIVMNFFPKILTRIQDMEEQLIKNPFL